MNTEFKIEETLLISKVLTRSTPLDVVGTSLNPLQPVQKVAPLRAAEVELIRESILPKITQLIKEYKDSLYSQLVALGEHQYMDGDGLLRIEDDKGEAKEYRVFAQTLVGTEYVGTFNTLDDAKGAWVNALSKYGINRQPEDVDVYVWQQFDGKWDTVQFYDLEDDEEIKQWVTETRADTKGHEEPSCKPFTLGQERANHCNFDSPDINV